ncbi:hypothetical protein [Mycobacterium sp.]|nr:hypothetical protein [Mycobacterium sp.]HTQ16290.1 hypothetical protein [Mycobacterium sp.]
MNRTAVRSGMLNKAIAWLRAGYSPGAPQLGHVALVALCPAQVRVSGHRA